MSWQYDSGGHHKDHGKYKDSFNKIFTNAWPCDECEGTRAKGHSEDCSKHWKNRSNPVSQETGS